jgi:arylsulfatase A-like enzyme
MFIPLLLTYALLSLAVLPASAQAARSTPNVVLIITDDVGYGDIGSYGAPDVKTPHIDGLARDGVRMTDFYANGATCTPTRAGLLSGRYQQRVGLEAPLGAGGPADRSRGLPVTGWSLPQLLKGNGYATALLGKWHLGWDPKFSPNAHGFDYFFGFKSGYTDYYQHTAGDGLPDLFENEQAVKVPGYMTDLITERAVSFVTEHATRPFFLEVAYNAAHWPYQVPDRPGVARDRGRHLNALDDSTSTRADYIAILERADAGIGAILNTLDSLGLRENTLVIFTNDNGGEWLSRSAPLFHHKGTVWEGGIRVPTILRWPNRIPAGNVSAQMGITMDLTATILAATNTTVPTLAQPDGINLLPVLSGVSPEIERTLFWRVAGATTQRAVRSGKWKLLYDGNRPMLFDLQADIGERDDVIGQHPEVAKRLAGVLKSWEVEVGERR